MALKIIAGFLLIETWNSKDIGIWMSFMYVIADRKGR